MRGIRLSVRSVKESVLKHGTVCVLRHLRGEIRCWVGGIEDEKKEVMFYGLSDRKMSYRTNKVGLYAFYCFVWLKANFYYFNCFCDSGNADWDDSPIRLWTLHELQPGFAV